MHDPTTGATAPRAPLFLRLLLRLWVLRGAQPAAYRGALSCAVLFGAAAIFAWICIDHEHAGAGAEFFAPGIPLLAWYVLAALLAALILRALCQPQAGLTACLALVAGWLPLPLLVVAFALPYLPTPALRAALAAASVYTAVYFARGLHALTGAAQWRSLAALLVYLGIGTAASTALDVVPELWSTPEAEPQQSEARDGPSEAALFEQSARIDRLLARLPAATATPGAYFLGFAGVGEERVFAQEIDLAAAAWRTRFGAAGGPLALRGSIALVNDERDFEAAPFASVWALDYALQGIAARMNLERDVLILSISSHGAQDPAIIVANADLPFDDLTDIALSEALRRARIKWRIIVISSCFAGGFIEALKDPNTIIITAAAPDRTSFGCGSDSELTYFGEAFYRDALPGSPNLRAAFDKARNLIAARERREHVEPSQPQAFFGTALESRLLALAHRSP
jgi:Peptidase C13 family